MTEDGNTLGIYNNHIKILKLQIQRPSLNRPDFSRLCDYIEETSPQDSTPHLLRITRVRYREKKNLIKAAESYIQTCYTLNVPFFCVLCSHRGEVSLYYGIFDRRMDTQASKALVAAFDAFFPGCETQPADNNKLHELLQTHQHRKVILGIPDTKRPDKNGDREKSDEAPDAEFGMERIADAAGDNNFALVVTAFPLSQEKITDYQNCIASTLNVLHPLIKASTQASHTEQSGTNDSFSAGVNNSSSEAESSSSSISQAMRQGNLGSRLPSDISSFFKGGGSTLKNESEQRGTQSTRQSGTNSTVSHGVNNSQAQSSAVTIETISKEAQFLESLLEKLYQRTQESLGTGMWNTVCTIMADDDSTANMIGDVFRGLMSGPGSFAEPLRCLDVPSTFNPFRILRTSGRGVQKLGEAYEGMSTYLTSTELTRYMAPPLHDMPGLDVQKLVEYARSLPKMSAREGSVELGVILDRGRRTWHPFRIPLDRLNRHCFITGATGSGKSTTIRGLLTGLWREHHIPFLVIDPVKAEYEALREQIPELQVYTLGRSSTEFALNPFSFEPSVGLTPHIDYLKAAFNASLGMYSSMPYILEDIIYKAYADCGWDLHTGENPALEACRKLLGEPGDNLRDLFLPTLSMLVPMVEDAINTFFPNATDYSGSLLGAIRSRLSSMTKGAKGDVLDRRFSTPMTDLLRRPCVLELWPFSDNEEKGFVMSLLLLKLFECRQAEALERPQSAGLRHVLVIEEAHRLLARPKGGSETRGSGRDKGVEVFADMLAEIRSYGQGIIIADQIPAKLIDDVVKNTDIKIAHRILARDDKETLASCMLLDKPQTEDLARLHRGTAAVFFEGMEKPAHVLVIPAGERAPAPADAPVTPAPDRPEQHVFSSNAASVRMNEKSRLLWFEHVRRLGTLALMLGPDELTALRRSAVVLPEGFGRDRLASCLSEGFCLLMDELSAAGVPSAWSTRLCSALYRVLLDWLLENDLRASWETMRRLSLQYGITRMAEAGDGTLDFADELIRIFVRSRQSFFQAGMTQALQGCVNAAGPSTAVQECLAGFIREMYAPVEPSPQLMAESGMRLLSKVRSDDPDIIEAAALHANLLKNMVRELSCTGENHHARQS